MLNQRTVQQIALFNKNDLSNWLSDPGLRENDVYEFKAEFYSGGGNNEECRKDFSAFANYLGGFIFIGIDNTKNVCGENVSEIDKLLNDKLKPLGRGLQWNVFKTIDLGNQKFVYVVAIEEVCHYWEKPLISDSVIYIRGNACVNTISSIGDVQNSFDFKRFMPSDIRYFEELLSSRGDALEKWSTTAEVIPIHYARIFIHCEAFLESELKNAASTETKRDLINVIDSFKGWRGSFGITEIRSSETTQPSELSSQDSKSDEIKVKLKDFIEKFNKTFKYE